MNLLNVKKYLAKPEIVEKIRGIAKKHGISLEDLLKVINLLVSNKISDDELAVTIEEETGVSFDTALATTLDLQRQVLNYFLDDLEDYHEKTGKLQEYFPDYLVNEVLKQLPEIKLDKVLLDRLTKAIITWLKDIRDKGEVAAVLTRPVKIGGLGLTEEQAGSLIKRLVAKKELMAENDIDLKNVLEEYEAANSDIAIDTHEVKEEEIDVTAKPKFAEPVNKENITGDDVTLEKLMAVRMGTGEGTIKDPNILTDTPKTDLASKIEATEQKLEEHEELAPPAPMVNPDDLIKEVTKTPLVGDLTIKPKKKAQQINNELEFKQTRPIVKESFKKNEPQVQAPPPVVNTPRSDQTIKSSSGRPKIQDVKFTPQLYGPIEELAAIKLEDFRRLSKDPKEATDKIIGKLDLLEDESLVKRVAGIKALKNSNLYKLYAQIMNEALMKSKTIEEVLKTQNTLTLDEYKAIMELNKHLKY